MKTKTEANKDVTNILFILISFHYKNHKDDFAALKTDEKIPKKKFFFGFFLREIRPYAMSEKRKGIYESSLTVVPTQYTLPTSKALNLVAFNIPASDSVKKIVAE